MTVSFRLHSKWNKHSANSFRNGILLEIHLYTFLLLYGNLFSRKKLFEVRKAIFFLPHTLLTRTAAHQPRWSWERSWCCQWRLDHGIWTHWQGTCKDDLAAHLTLWMSWNWHTFVHRRSVVKILSLFMRPNTINNSNTSWFTHTMHYSPNPCALCGHIVSSSIFNCNFIV